MAVKIIDNISIVQAIPNVNTEIVRDVSKPLSFYLVGTGSGQWSATVTLYEIDPIGYKKIGNDTSFTVTNSNPMELFTWSSNAKSFVIRVSSIKNASVTVYMTQAESSQLERILLTEPSQGTKAMPSDIVGCAAEYVAGQGWIGNLGVLDSKAVLDSFPTNALVPGKVWAIVASASSFAKYNYMSAGWVLESSVGATGASNLPGSPSAPFASTTERTAWAAANLSTLPPGRTTAWGPGNVEYVWNGPLATDWQGIRGPYLGSAENPFPDAAALPNPATIPIGQYFVNKLAGSGVMKMQNFGGVWRPEKNSFTIYEGVDNFSVVSSGSTSPVILPLFTIPADFIKNLDTYRIRYCYFADAANSGADGVGITIGGVDVAPLTVSAGQSLWVDGDLNRTSDALRRVRFLTSAGGSVSPAIMNVDLSVAQVVAAKITPANSANKTYLRRISMERA